MREDTSMQHKQNKAWAEQRETKGLSTKVFFSFIYMGMRRDRYHYNRLLYSEGANFPVFNG